IAESPVVTCLILQFWQPVKQFSVWRLSVRPSSVAVASATRWNQIAFVIMFPIKVQMVNAYSVGVVVLVPCNRFIAPMA
ncbi:hypothetical protein, partial [Streptococcus mitis]|uniref:hypothetical protein n=1 Tax=Streptococcus mitis TaxID=28037 RepID=UPI0021B530F3